MDNERWRGVSARLVRITVADLVIMGIAIAVEAVGLATSHREVWLPAMVVFMVGWVVLAVCIVAGIRQFTASRRRNSG